MPSQATLSISVGAKTHPGKVRSENQDRMSRFNTPLGEVFLVADGMGGHQGGAVAASTTSSGMESHLANVAPGTSPAEALELAARKTNLAIYQKANSGDPATARMGATVVLALHNGRQLWVAHAGDSRAYLLRNGQLKRLTKDHSAIQKMIDHDLIAEADARDHPDAGVINRAFGQRPEVELEISEPIDIQSGDGLLLCTDGLCGYVDDASIESAICDQEHSQKVADALIDLALEAGGEDNVSVQFIQFGSRPKTAHRLLMKGQMSSAQTRSGEDQPGASSSRDSDVASPRGMKLTFISIVLSFLVGFALGGAYAPNWLRRSSSKDQPPPLSADDTIARSNDPLTPQKNLANPLAPSPESSRNASDSLFSSLPSTARSDAENAAREAQKKVNERKRRRARKTKNTTVTNTANRAATGDSTAGGGASSVKKGGASGLQPNTRPLIQNPPPRNSNHQEDEAGFSLFINVERPLKGSIALKKIL